MDETLAYDIWDNRKTRTAAGATLTYVFDAAHQLRKSARAATPAPSRRQLRLRRSAGCSFMANIILRMEVDGRGFDRRMPQVLLDEADVVAVVGLVGS